MKKIKFTYSLFIYLFFLCIFSTSCINEAPDCFLANNKGDIKVYFSYLKKVNSGKGINPSEIKSMTIYAFDSNGKYHLSKTETNITLDENYFMTLSLDKGDYHFVAWGNLESPYQTLPPIFEVGVTDKESAIMYLQRPQSDFITSTVPYLFFGSNNSIHVNPEIEQTFVIPLVQNTNNITLIVKGLKHNNDNFLFTITDNNSKYNFDNSFAQDTDFSYSAPMIANNVVQLTSTLRTLRLAEKRLALLKITNTTQDKIIYKHSLIDLLVKLETQNASVDWKNTHDFVIILTFDANLNVSIIINGWNVIDNEAELPK